MVTRRTSLIALPLLAALTVFLIGNAYGSASHVDAQNKPTLALDMNPTNGNGPCDPIDGTRSVNAGDTFEIAMCLTDALTSPKDFDIRVIYDDTLDQCVPVDCPAGIGCLDTNPDANAGATTWTSPDLGTDCDCSIGGELPPVCDQDPGTGRGKGQTLLWCGCMEPTLSVGEGISTPLGMITFKNVQPGTDHITFGTSSVSDSDFMVIAQCDETQCFGGTLETLVSLTPTPTVGGTPPAGTTPGAETTPGGEVATPEPGAATAAAATAVAQGTPIAAINQAATATSAAVATKAAISAKTPKATAKPGSTSEESGGSSGPNAFLIAGIVAGCVIVAGGAGWFGYRRFRATR
ncbi:MAG: hypothetical protein MUP15_00540 [Dehalococcoidia bacterium]|nr:hypothetical protein [Dehalococcoidia bacterium]